MLGCSCRRGFDREDVQLEIERAAGQGMFAAEQRAVGIETLHPYRRAQTEDRIENFEQRSDLELRDVGEPLQRYAERRQVLAHAMSIFWCQHHAHDIAGDVSLQRAFQCGEQRAAAVYVATRSFGRALFQHLGSPIANRDLQDHRRTIDDSVVMAIVVSVRCAIRRCSRGRRTLASCRPRSRASTLGFEYDREITHAG